MHFIRIIYFCFNPCIFDIVFVLGVLRSYRFHVGFHVSDRNFVSLSSVAVAVLLQFFYSVLLLA